MRNKYSQTLSSKPPLFTHIYKYHYEKPLNLVLLDLEEFLCAHPQVEDYFTTPIKSGMMFKIIMRSGKLGPTVFLSAFENASPRKKESSQ
jgi:hypothetical protein